LPRDIMRRLPLFRAGKTLNALFGKARKAAWE
jgi:hypothetical protein